MPPCAYLNDAAVVPLDYTVQFFSVVEHESHLCLLLDLLLKVESLSVGARSVALRIAYECMRERVACVGWIATALGWGKVGPYQLACTAERIGIQATLVCSSQIRTPIECSEQ